MTAKTKNEGFTAEERAAMKARASEIKSGRGSSKADKAAAEAQDCLDKIAAMPDAEREIGERLHSLVTSVAPDLAVSTWYGMPAYKRDGKALLYFKNAAKFKMRYSEIGFGEPASLDDGDLWPIVYAVTGWSKAVEKQLTGLIEQATS